MIQKKYQDNYFMNEWYQHLAEEDSRPCMCDTETLYTRNDVEKLSGKIYKLLKDEGISKGDFVLIDLPRSSKIFIAMLGINKAGAAYVVVESGFAKERRDYIYQNTGSKYVINEDTFSALDKIEYLNGYEATDLHDVAFAIYTSGTTGVPKGVMHEFGSYEMLRQSIKDPLTGELRQTINTRFLNIAPFNFIASVMIFALGMYSGGTIYTPDYDVVKNIKRLIEYMHVYKINQAFFSPSLLKLISDKLNPEIELVYTGAEQARGVTIPHGELYNLYLMSETGFVLCQYKIEEAEEVSPVGKPNTGIEVSLSKEGEVVCCTPYCRGYFDDSINTAFVDGYYHTGDIAELNVEGNYVLKGRNVEMIKINGNRVEPLEVEVVASKILVDKIPCAVKAFEKEDKAFICLYYESKEDLDKNHLREQMEEYLPYYMIPSYFIRLEKLPRTAAGKINKSELKEPVLSKTTEYVSPRNKTEEKFCEVFKNVLNVEKIGVSSDLFDLGLDSLRAIEAITELNIDEIKTTDVYKYRTIEDLVKYYNESQNTFLTQYEKEMEGRKHLYPLNSLSSAPYYMAKMLPNSTAHNISFALRFGKVVNAEKLRDAINKCTDNSMFKVTLVEDAEGKVLQKYSPELYKPLHIECMDEDEVEELIKTFVRPFNIIGDLPYRIRLIKTKRNLYLFFDIHHYLTDGMGVREFGENIGRAYRGKEISPFNYFAYCYDYQKVEDRQEFQQNAGKELERLLGNEYGGQPYAPGEEIAYVNQEYNTNISLKKMNRFIEKNNVTRNTVILSAVNLYLAKYNKRNRNLISWIYANREPNRNQAGELATGLIAGVRLDKKMTIADVFEAVENEVSMNIKHITSGLYMTKLTEGTEIRSLSVDDLGDIEEINPVFSTITTSLKLERPYDIIKGVPLWYTNLNVLNKGGNLWLRLVTDNSKIKESVRDEMLIDVARILERLLDGDETIVTECLDFE